MRRCTMSFDWLKRGPVRAICAALALSTSMLVAAPAGAQTITAVMSSGLRVLDPVVSSAAITNVHGYMIYDTLLGTDAQFKVQPQMAERWEISPDGKTYTFTLRDGLKWHDGAPVKAEDCVASIKRWGEVDIMGKVLFGLVIDIKIVGVHTFQIVYRDRMEMV